ncbi:hypothetical protein jhhlp_003319 [Lomentospora prolificans]|uniref:4-hydroxy-2-oxoglutarate aldolase, mitochondrial n=1 Tax=Lomentospora prolificans TaxID=41688 RepID=A0A2N3NGK2_9PEZI|nr:hypothetical protein jhhlp_003319 [Lomentospora prolificans]
MSPHNDTSSPRTSFHCDFTHLSMVSSSGLRAVDISVNGSHSPMGSSFDGSSVDADFQRSEPRRVLRPGVYVPTVCFFEPSTENIDVESIAQHAVRLAKAGVAGLATQGSNGEAVHLTHSERQLVTATTRKALNENGFRNMPIIVGCGCQSTRETIQYCREAWEAGGDYALVLPPSYYAPLFAPSSQTVLQYFRDVADASPIPILIYNFPGGAGGLDLTSDVIIALAQHPNIVGAKFTCGNTGKLNRVAEATRNMPRKPAIGGSGDNPGFLVLAGSADFSLQSAIAGGHGILAGLANLAPKACVRTLELFHEGKIQEAQEMQRILSHGDWTAIQGGVVGMKAGMESWLAYGGFARSPLPKPTRDQSEKWKEGFRSLVMLEKRL